MTVNTNGEDTMLGIQRDSKGRPDVRQMTDREIAEATLQNQRAMLDLVNDFVAKMENNPMLRMMAGKR